jgi:DNA-binding NarL/FixJ family response regulator
MATIHVLIWDAPNMLRSILERVIADEPDMELMAEPPEPGPLPSGAPPAPDVLVVDGRDADAGERGRALLGRWPQSRVLMFTAHGHKVVLYELVPQGSDLGELSPGQLVQAIRSAARPEQRPRAQ